MNGSSATIGGQVTLDTLANHELIRRNYPVLAEAAETVATPQIRHVGTLAGNVCQRPWCWYYRNGFKCYKAGGNMCYSIAGENQFHAIFGGGPSFIVHPSDTAPALVALEATFRIVGPGGERFMPAADFFVLPRANATQENVLAPNEILPTSAAAAEPARAQYKVSTAKRTHAVVSAAVVMEMDGGVCRSARA
jgi:xanthine dehydrogenase YagS FAD-binding subunit